MFAAALLLLLIPIAFVIGGIAAFIMLPVKAGIVVAILAFTAAAIVVSWITNSIDLSH